MPVTLPQSVVAARRSICGRCDEPCAAYAAGEVRHDEPCAACPRSWRSAWGQYGECANYEPAKPDALPGRARAAARVGRAVKARRLAAALRRWARAGFPLTLAGERRARQATCGRCEHWRPTGNAGLGECGHPSCGCSRAKHWLATETCPAGKWPEVPLRGVFSRLAVALRRPFDAVCADLSKPGGF